MYCDRLYKSGLSSLHVIITRNMAIETYEVINVLSPPVLSDLVVKKRLDYYF